MKLETTISPPISYLSLGIYLYCVKMQSEVYSVNIRDLALQITSKRLAKALYNRCPKIFSETLKPPSLIGVLKIFQYALLDQSFDTASSLPMTSQLTLIKYRPILKKFILKLKKDTGIGAKKKFEIIQKLIEVCPKSQKGVFYNILIRLILSGKKDRIIAAYLIMGILELKFDNSAKKIREYLDYNAKYFKSIKLELEMI